MRHAGAALGVDVASFIGSSATPKFSLMGEQGIYDDAKNLGLSFGLSSEIANAGTAAHGMAAKANAQKGAIAAQGQAQYNSNIAAGIESGIKGFAGGLGGLSSGGGGGYGMMKIGGQDSHSFLPSNTYDMGFTPDFTYGFGSMGGYGG